MLGRGRCHFVGETPRTKSGLFCLRHPNQSKHGHDPLYTGGEFRRLARARPVSCHRVLHTT
jgi:hypothetical protein